jgi:hypothetical protein
LFPLCYLLLEFGKSAADGQIAGVDEDGSGR